MMSPVDGEFRSGGASAARVGSELRAARERLGWTLPAIAQYLRIRRPYLEAIEEGRTADLPGNAYAIGFLRTYAQALGLDPDEISRRFRAEATEANRKTELNFPAPVPERGIPAGAVVLVGGLIAVGAYVGWYKMSGNRHPSTQIVQTVPERLAPLADRIAPPSPAATPVTVAQTPALVPAAPVVPVPVPPAPSVSPSSAAAAGVPAPAAATPSVIVASPAATVIPASPVPSQPAATSQAVALANPLPTPSSAATPAKPDGARVVLRAKADAWMQVREKGGAVLLNRVLRAGETWSVPAKAALLLTTGNAAGTEVLLDGVATGSLGGDGAVRRDLPLDPDAIKDGKLAPPAPVKH